MTAVNKAKKNPAIPVAPTSKIKPPIIIGINAKNFNLYAINSGNMNFLYFFLILNFFARPSISAVLSAMKKQNKKKEKELFFCF